MRAIFGLDPVKSGKVRIGAYSGEGSPSRRWNQGVGFVSEDRKTEGLALSMSLADNMTMSKLSGLGPLGLILHSVQGEKASSLIEDIKIKCSSPFQKVGELSGGNQQKAAIARLLHHDVDILLLDEPTRGIDIGAKSHIYELVDSLTKGRSGSSKPKSVIMVSSYLPELLGVCDRIAVMCKGVLGPARNVAETDEKMIMLEATGLTP